MTPSAKAAAEQIAAQRRAANRLIVNLTKAFTRDELGELFDSLSTLTATERALAEVVGAAWADYDTAEEHWGEAARSE